LLAAAMGLLRQSARRTACRASSCETARIGAAALKCSR
jgi:hypothetical protein